jgi:nitrile hydratase alpha subunit
MNILYPGQHTPHEGVHSNQEPGYYSKLTSAMEIILVEKGIITADQVQRAIAALDKRDYMDGAKIIAKAWTDPIFKTFLIADGISAVRQLGYTAEDDFAQLVVVENTESVHNLVVCTLCSCYPRWLLGRPPDWYKSLNYRSRAVRDPRGVLKEFGLALPNNVEIRVVDSTADIRYMVLPKRPKATQNWIEEDLAKLVTRNSLIGVAEPLQSNG